MKVILCFCLLILTNCGTVSKLPKTQGDPLNVNSYGYHPLDPLPVELEVDTANPLTNSRLLKAMPDETIRLAIGQVISTGGLKFTTASAGYEGNSYVVVLDYIKFNTNSFNVKVDRSNGRATKANVLEQSSQEGDAIIPLYIGVGLRLTANITINKGQVDLGNLFAIGAQAASQRISGTLTVQTLGISGENISAVIPMPSEINTTTIQNAILALGMIKAKIYEDNTTITPRVVGVYNNIGGSTEVINGFISSILQKPKILAVK